MNLLVAEYVSIGQKCRNVVCGKKEHGSSVIAVSTVLM